MTDPPATFRQLVRDMRALQKAEARDRSRTSRRAALKLELRVDAWLERARRRAGAAGRIIGRGRRCRRLSRPGPKETSTRRPGTRDTEDVLDFLQSLDRLERWIGIPADNDLDEQAYQRARDQA